MRLKSSEGPLSVHNGNNPEIVNSPKRINTLQNSNITSNYPSNLTNNGTLLTRNVIGDLNIRTGEDENTLNNITSTEDSVQWCISSQVQQKRELTNNANNRNNHLFNINNNTLAASLRGTRHGTASSIYSESSPDDSLLDYEEAHQSCSSVDASPQDDEDRGFDISDSESLSEDGNLSNTRTIQRRGIVNPNYPGFQHLAHTLDYSIKGLSDTDFTDDDFDCESTTAKLNAEANTINNNNNNNVEDTEFHVDKIDSVNRLDSVENIQKVFYDKPGFNLPIESENFQRNSSVFDETSANSNQCSDDDLEINRKIELNIKADEAVVKSLEKVDLRESSSCGNIIGDFGKEVEQEFGRITRENQITNPGGKALATAAEQTTKPDQFAPVHENTFEPFVERAVVQELEEAVEKLSVSNDLQPSAARYKIEPNTEQPFNKLPPNIKNIRPVILQDSKTITMATLIQTPTAAGFNGDIKINNLNASSVVIDNDYKIKVSDAFLSNVQESLPKVHETLFVDPNQNTELEMDVENDMKKSELSGRDSNRQQEEQIKIPKTKQEVHKNQCDELEKFCKEDITKDDKEKDEDSAVPRKKEKVEINYAKKRRDYNQQIGSLITIPRRDLGGRNRDSLNRRSVPIARDKKRASPEVLGGFDVYNIETAMPKIDLEAIESHLRAAREEERRRRTDREEIRRRLAMGAEDDYYNGCDRPGRKPSLQARLQSGMNLQICFMNETVSDTESPSSDSECTMMNSKQPKISPKNNVSPVKDNVLNAAPIRPATLSIGQHLLQPLAQPMIETDFFTRQARLQTEARMALAQAKEMARMQMEIERQRQKKSPITEMVRYSLEKVGIPFPEERRRLSRQILTEMNVAQLQVIVNDLHTQIETLNENLVKYLMDRDDLHMEQDSMLVDIEDLTRYLGAKEQTIKEQNFVPQNNNIPPPSPAPSSPLAALNSTVKPHLHRIASLVKK